MVLPDRFIDHDTPAKQYDEAGLNAAQIVATAQDALGIARPGIVALSSEWDRNRVSPMTLREPTVTPVPIASPRPTQITVGLREVAKSESLARPFWI